MSDLEYMKLAFLEAKKAFLKGEVPIGAIVVVNNKVISKAHNLRHTKRQVLYHAEVLAISKACKKLKRWILDDATIYVTVEPCLMCSGVIMQARMKKIVYGLKEEKFGAINSVIDVNKCEFNHKVEVVSGLYEEEIKNLMQSFFKKIIKEKADEDRKYSNK